MNSSNKFNHMNENCEYVVRVKDAYKSYGSKSENFGVLCGLNMSIKRNSIYALIGASGVGKTTLIKSIIGIETLQSGVIELFRDCTKSNHKLIGYMPQEIAILQKFTAKEMLNFLGVLNGVNTNKIKEKINFLSSLLEFPNDDKLIETCSGGEQRRISFACALMHDPRLLILDEPTVGVDPILRNKIWDFLKTLVTTTDTTVIISTHYIQESINATTVGFIRNGTILVEEEPQTIIQNLQADNLEEAFFKLSFQQNGNQKEVNREFLKSIQHDDKKKKISAMTPTEISFSRLFALLFKNLIHQRRNIVMCLFSCFMPLIMIASIYSYGRHPEDLQFGVLNLENLNFDANNCPQTNIVINDLSNEDMSSYCNFHNISCRYIMELQDIFNIRKSYNTFKDAESDVLNGHIYGFILIGQDFSNHLQTRFNNGMDLKYNISDDDLINVYLDQTNYQIANFIKKSLYESYDKFTEKLTSDCGRNYNTETLPMKIKAMFGKLNDEYRKTMSIGGVIVYCFFLSSSLSVSAIIEDQAEGIIERILLAGTRPLEIILSHLISSTVIIIIHYFQYYTFLAYMFKDDLYVNHIWASITIILVGIAGVVYGLSVSTLTKSPVVGMFCSSSIFLPVLAIGGVIWPLEGVVYYLRYFSYLLPFTMPSLALTGIMYKGYTIKHSAVFMSYLILVIWILGGLFICFSKLKIRQ
ncbi:ABC transporter G family member 23-like [Chironomus tepperi]|uniref:ABC transporter G family member 23-like n=1 Tax=Chironomus tepperi TaxID=113505 RepID=UPI00391EFC7B